MIPEKYKSDSSIISIPPRFRHRSPGRCRRKNPIQKSQLQPYFPRFCVGGKSARAADKIMTKM